MQLRARGNATISPARDIKREKAKEEDAEFFIQRIESVNRKFYLVDNLVPELKKKKNSTIDGKERQHAKSFAIKVAYDDVYVKFSRILSAIYLLNNYDINKLIS